MSEREPSLSKIQAVPLELDFHDGINVHEANVVLNALYTHEHEELQDLLNLEMTKDRHNNPESFMQKFCQEANSDETDELVKNLRIDMKAVAGESPLRDSLRIDLSRETAEFVRDCLKNYAGYIFSRPTAPAVFRDVSANFTDFQYRKEAKIALDLKSRLELFVGASQHTARKNGSRRPPGFRIT